MKLIIIFIAIGMLIGTGLYTFWYAKGYSYLLNDPKVCVNCHIMRDNFNSWIASSHRNVTCNDCHIPHSFIGKYIAKMENGFRHSFSFTFENVQVLRITQQDLHNLQENCIRCHKSTVDMILINESKSVMSCTRCHKGVGHTF